ncbi:LysR family transcriptional regulator [uncultured Limnohabitans sp.]|uniref:LysR family transcriptional regulator n=1 Tax=uncultured Limnohabitans sp. TaxID=768543 RepID=UPI0026179632|nr:LysR family transcriptional regulator [uncultured Limnohabitans sp.]
MPLNANWDDLRLFLAVAEQGSFSAAARLLKQGQATLSRRMAEFEAALGEPVFERSSLGARLTPLGRKLLPSAQAMAEWAAEAQVQQAGTGRTSAMQGKVRVAAPPSIAYDFLAPMAADIRRAHPGLQIEVLSAVKLLNLSRGEADIALRTFAPQDPDLLCLDSISAPIKAYACSDYVQRLPAHYGAKDLDWICWAAPYDEVQINQELRALIPNFKAAFTSDDHNVQFAACRAGVGALLMAHVQHRYTQLGQLCALPLDFGPQAVGHLHMVCHKRTAQLSPVVAVREYISAEFAYMRAQQGLHGSALEAGLGS